ncbi:50S ribosomal protein L25 [Megalodesulfovibrio paquesii]
MAEQISLAATRRDSSGKGPNRRLRVAGQIPAVYYTASGDNLALTIDALAFEKAYRQIGTSKLFSLVVDGEEGRPTLVWKVQKHPFKRQVVHLDLYGVDYAKKVTLNVPVRQVGEAPGLKLGGMMETFHDTITVTCLPGDIPAVVDLDVSKMQVGDAFTVKDVVLPENVMAVYKQNYALLSVVATRKAAPGPGGKD